MDIILLVKIGQSLKPENQKITGHVLECVYFFTQNTVIEIL